MTPSAEKNPLSRNLYSVSPARPSHSSHTQGAEVPNQHAPQTPRSHSTRFPTQPPPQSVRLCLTPGLKTTTELTFQQFITLPHTSLAKNQGFTEITQTCLLAREKNLGWACVDTCCVDKSSSAELTATINSMWRRYACAGVHSAQSNIRRTVRRHQQVRASDPCP